MFSDWQQIVVVETIHKFTTDRKALVEAQTTSPAATAGGAGVYSEQQPMRVRCYIFIGLFLFGGIVQLVTVFIAKYSVGKLSCCLGVEEGVGITVDHRVLLQSVYTCLRTTGRLRPNFISVCQPDWSLVECTDERGYQRYVNEDVCTQEHAFALSDSR